MFKNKMMLKKMKNISIDRSITKSSDCANVGKVRAAKDACDIKSKMFSKTQCPSKAEDEQEKSKVEYANNNGSPVNGAIGCTESLNVEKLRMTMNVGGIRSSIDFVVKTAQHPGKVHDEQETTDSGNTKNIISLGSTMIMSSDSNNLKSRNT
jgi:hypothetical protein